MPCSPRSTRPPAPIVVATPSLLSSGAKNETRLSRVAGRIVRMRRVCGWLYGGGVDFDPPEPPLSDGVVLLRPWTLGDVPAIVSACNETEIARWIHQIPSPYAVRDAREYVLSTQAAWTDGAGAFFAFEERTGGGIAGSIAVHVLDRDLANLEVGYWTAAAAR